MLGTETGTDIISNLNDNVKVRQISRAGSVLKRAGIALSVAVGGYEIYHEWKSDDSLQDKRRKTVVTVGETVGSIAGGLVGGALGSLIPIPGVGTFLGGVVGGMVGGQ